MYDLRCTNPNLETRLTTPCTKNKTPLNQSVASIYSTLEVTLRTLLHDSTATATNPTTYTPGMYYRYIVMRDARTLKLAKTIDIRVAARIPQARSYTCITMHSLQIVRETRRVYAERRERRPFHANLSYTWLAHQVIAPCWWPFLLIFADKNGLGGEKRTRCRRYALSIMANTMAAGVTSLQAYVVHICS